MLEINLSGNPAVYLDSLGKYSKLAVIEQSSKAGDHARKAIRAEFDKETTEWDKKYENGQLKAFVGHTKLGKRISHKSQKWDDPSNMKNFITSMTNATTGTTVIMGAYKGHKPLKIRDGKVEGYENYQPTITRRTIAILEKLNTGKKSSTYRRQFASGVKGQFRGEQPYKNRGWAERGWNKSLSQVKSEMTDKLLTLIANFELQKGAAA